MPIFECSKCHCIENTATSNHVLFRLKKEKQLCSECDPKIGKWHNIFKKEKVDFSKYEVDEFGFLKYKEK